MSKPDLTIKSSITQHEVARYVVDKIVIESTLEKRLRDKTSELPNGGMISSSDVGALLALLAQTANTVKAIEVGTFTGYTALKIAGVLPKDGKLICCDVSEEWTNIGKDFWLEAGVGSKIDLRLAPALQTLKGLVQEGQAGTFDFAFIDADKMGYDSYYEVCLELLRPGGLIVLDNMLWDGAVADLEIQDETTCALRALNEKVSKDGRVNSCLLTVGDGLMMARKK
jgi:predicted O-methyltransferase YrrM